MDMNKPESSEPAEQSGIRFPSPKRPTHHAGALIALALLIAGAGCDSVPHPDGKGVTEISPDEHGYVRTTGPESTDLVAVADKMARSIVGIPQIANAASPPVIVIEPVNNETRFPIDKKLFLTRIRVQLNQQAAGKVIFLDRAGMNAILKERELKRQGQVTSSSDPNVQELKGADFILTGELRGIPSRTKDGVSDYILYAFHLSDVRTSAIIWESFAEVKKQGLEDAAYK